MYDWNVKAAAMKYFPDFYDFSKSPDINVFDNNGKFFIKNVKDREIEQMIYRKAKEFQFEDPKELVRLTR